MIEEAVPAGHRRVKAGELKGEPLAWAVAAVYRMPAAILEGRVNVEATPGTWVKFDPSDMLRSLVLGHAPEVLVPDELYDRRRTSKVKLTRRERECLLWAARGKSDAVIATMLGISPRTVHNFVERAKDRFEVATRTQAIVHAIADGQITFDEIFASQQEPAHEGGHT